jgi:hypothetical protein
LLVALDAVLATIVVVPIVSYTLQRRYAKAVVRGMASTSGLPNPARNPVVVEPTILPDRLVADAQRCAAPALFPY